MPIGIRDDVLGHLDNFRSAAKQAGRDPDEMDLTVFGAAPDPDGIRRFRDAGVRRCIFFLPPRGRDDVLPILDKYTSLMSAVGK